MSKTILRSAEFLLAPAQKLFLLDFGLFQVHDNGRIIDIPGYLIQTREGVNILVDTGFPAKYVHDPDESAIEDGLESFGRLLHLTEDNLPPGQLARIGLTPNDVDMLILTHSDIDHIGGIDLFPGVPIVIGQAERALPRPRYFGDRSPLTWPENVDYRLIERDTVLCPGVAVLTSPGHSPGQLSLVVRLAVSGVILLTGDAIARPAELQEGFAGAWDEEQAAESAARLMQIAADEKALIIFGHDPAQREILRKAPLSYS